MCPLTVSLHVDLKTLAKPARLALIPPGHVDHAPSVLLANVLQVPEEARGLTLSVPFVPRAGKHLRMLLLKKPLQPSQLGTP